MEKSISIGNRGRWPGFYWWTDSSILLFFSSCVSSWRARHIFMPEILGSLCNVWDIWDNMQYLRYQSNRSKANSVISNGVQCCPWSGDKSLNKWGAKRINKTTLNNKEKSKGFQSWWDFSLGYHITCQLDHMSSNCQIPIFLGTLLSDALTKCSEDLSVHCIKDATPLMLVSLSRSAPQSTSTGPTPRSS